MIEVLVQFNQKLMSLPAGAVMMLFAIALGYALKSASFFPNNLIPLVVMSVCGLFFPLVQFCADRIADVPKAAWHVPLNLLAGFVLGAFAWLVHAQVLRRWVDPRFALPDKSSLANPPPESPGGLPNQP